MKKSTYLIALALGASTTTFAQNVGINTDGSDPDANTLLHLNNDAGSSLDSALLRIENEKATTGTGVQIENSGTASSKWDVFVPGSSTDLRIKGNGSDHVTIQNDGDVGISTTNPVSGLDVQTSMGLAHTTVTTTATLNQTHNVVLASDASGDFTITLPAASSNSGKVYYIKKTNSSENEITIDGNGGETIDGATTVVLYVQYDAIRILSDGSNWHIIADERKAHFCALRKTAAAQSIPNGFITTKVLLTNEDVDVGGIGDPTTNNRIDIKRAGNYYLDAYVLIKDIAPTEQIVVRIRVNGLNKFYTTNHNPNDNRSYAWCDAKISGVLNLSAGDYVDLTIEHDSTFGNRDTYSGTSGAVPYLSVTEIR